MHKYLTAIAFLLIYSGCEKRSPVGILTDTIKTPTLSIRVDPSEKSILIAVISNTSEHELSIPGFDDELIYGSYWYQNDKVINVPECGTGFWDSVIKIPPGKSRELQLPVPRTTPRGETLTVAVVYAGLGTPTDKKHLKKVSLEEWLRHPDISLNCRKMETKVSLPMK